MAKMNTYKIGDKVKIVNPDKGYPIERFPIGTIGVITEIGSDTEQGSVIGIKGDGENRGFLWWYFPREIRPYPYTNAEKIRCMSDEEMAAFLEKHFCHERRDLILEWLKEKADAEI